MGNSEQRRSFKMMKINRHLVVFVCLTAVRLCAQPKYPFEIAFKVSDDAGMPVSAGFVRASSFASWERGEGFGRSINDNYRAPINEEGVAVMSGLSLRGTFAYGVYAEGRYYSGFGGELQLKEVLGGRWEPWRLRVEVVIPRILEPTALFARKYGLYEREKIPAEKPIGFDLMVSDWVAPYGKGKVADFLLDYKTIVPLTDETKAFECSLTLTFSNPGDGFQTRSVPATRRLLILPRRAPEEGYNGTWSKRFGRPREGADLLPLARADENFFFRVRTVLGVDGRVVGALYGKIYGDIVFDALGHIRFTYYLNPTVNDRNLEFDPKRNLFPDTLSGANVGEP
jgi:hypothetical protein